MQEPVKPENESERLAELCGLHILDTAGEERFDRITRTAQKMFGVQIALISLVDAERQWFKSKQGLAAEQTPRDISFCGHAILGSEVFVVEDASLDPRFSDNPLVTQAPFIRFYAGVPVTGALGYKLGTLCIIDSKPRVFSADDDATLQDMASWVEAELSAGFYLNAALDSDSRLSHLLGHVRDSIFTLDEYANIKTINTAAQELFGFTEQQLLGQNICKLLAHYDNSELFLSEFIQHSGSDQRSIAETKEVLMQAL